MELGPFNLTGANLIIFSQLISHRFPDLCSQPEQFLPDRWLTLTPSPYAYFPFAAGPRMCLGATLAQMTLRITLPVIWQRVHLQVTSGASINAKVRSTMLFPTFDMPMLVSPTSTPFKTSYVTGNIHDLVNLPETGTSITELSRAA